MLRNLLEGACRRLDQLQEEAAPFLAQDMNKIMSSLEETKSDLSQVQAAQGMLQAERRRPPTPEVASEDGKDVRMDGSLRLRLEALEMKVDQQVPRSLQLESQVKELRTTVTPMSSRLQALETQMRKSSWETAPLQARLDAAEAEILKLARDKTESEGLRADVEALKRRHLQSVERPPAQRSVGRKGFLPEDLRENISNLVHKVNDTVSRSLPERTQSQGSDAGSGPSQPGRSEKDLQDQLQLLLGQGVTSQESYNEVLAAIQELRERNLELREKNAYLVEDMLARATRV
ncbi:unnamed protein product [Effrenium voratum]|nr:unnamed protein product [Effrenium voratum]